MIYFHEHTDSTNRIAKEMVAEGAPTGTVVVAAAQSAGRGQYGRTFNSPLGGLYFSYIVEPTLPPEKISLVTLATGLACRNVLSERFQLNALIKWPNDLYLAGKKVAGILCEHLGQPHQYSTESKVIIGVGLNVNSRIEQFDPEVQPLVTTLFEHTGHTRELTSLLDDLLHAILLCVERLATEQNVLLEEWQRFDLLKGRPVTYTNPNGTIEGVGLGINQDGMYLVRDEMNQEHTIVGGQLRPSHRQGYNKACF